MTDDSPSPFLTVPEVARLLGVSRERGYELVAKGSIPSIRLSERRIRIPRASFDAWLSVQAERAIDGLAPEEAGE